MKTAIVTGISSGTGHGTASVLIKQGWRVYGSVRNKADARAVTHEFREQLVPLIFDVTDHEALFAAAAEVQKQLGDEPSMAWLTTPAARTLIR